MTLHSPRCQQGSGVSGSDWTSAVGAFPSQRCSWVLIPNVMICGPERSQHLTQKQTFLLEL